MARIENKPKVILTQEEIETLRNTQSILCELWDEDTSGKIFDLIDNYESEWGWMVTALQKLVEMSEVENNG